MRRIAVLVGLHGLIKRRCSVRATPCQSVTCVATNDYVPTSRVRVGSQVNPTLVAVNPTTGTISALTQPQATTAPEQGH